MTAQKGREVLVKIDTGGGSFSTVAGMRSKQITLNATPVDITNTDSAGWREFLAGAGVKSADIRGTGVFTDSSTEELVRSKWFAGTLAVMQFIVPSFGTIEGSFHIQSIEYAGPHEREATYVMAFLSAGALTWTAA